MDPVVLRIDAEVTDALAKTLKLRDEYVNFAATYTRAMGDMSRVVNEFSGDKITRDAKNLVSAIGDVGNVSKLTAKEQASVNSTLSEFIEKSGRLGREVPADFRRIFEATSPLSRELKRLSESFSGATVKREADIYLRALGGVQNVTKLTESEQRRLNQVVTEAIAKYRALGEQAPRDLQAVANATAGAATTSSNFASQFFSALAGGVSVGYVVGRAVIGVFHSITGAISDTLTAAKDLFGYLVTRGTDVDKIASGFRRLTGSFSEEILAAGRRGIRGLATDMDLMTAANRAVLLGLPITAKTFEDLTGAATLLGRAMGLDAGQALKDLTVALGRISPRILDNLGIIVKVRDANREYADSIRKKVNDLNAEERQIAFYLKANEAMAKKVKELSSLQFNLGDTIQITKVHLTNFTDSLAVAVAKSPALIAAATDIGTALIKSFGGDKVALVNTLIYFINIAVAKVLSLIQVVVWMAKPLAEVFLALPVIWSTVLMDLETLVIGILKKFKWLADGMAKVPIVGASWKQAQTELDGMIKYFSSMQDEYARSAIISADVFVKVTTTLNNVSSALYNAKEKILKMAGDQASRDEIAKGFLDLAKEVVDGGDKVSEAEARRLAAAEKKREAAARKAAEDYRKLQAQLLDIEVKAYLAYQKEVEQNIKSGGAIATARVMGILKEQQLKEKIYASAPTFGGSPFFGEAVMGKGYQKYWSERLDVKPPGYKEVRPYSPTNLIKQWEGAKGMDKLTVGYRGAMDVLGAATSIWGATGNARSRAGAGLSGAMAGAQAGQAFGPWGIAVGAAAGLVVGLIRGKADWAKAADEVGRDFGVKISDGLAKAIEKDATELFRGDRATASVYNLSKIIEESGGVTIDNVKKWTSKVKDVFSFVERGQLSVAQGAKVVDETFGQLVTSATDKYGYITKDLKQLIDLNKQFGTESKAIADYLKGQYEKLGGANQKVVEGLSNVLGNAFKTLTKDQMALADAIEDTDKRKAAQDAITREANDKLVISYQTTFDRVTRITLASYKAMLAGGKSTAEAMDAIGGSVDLLIKGVEETGFKGSKAYEELARWRKLTTEFRPLLDSVGSLNDLSAVLYNTGSLTKETFDDLLAQAYASSEEMRKAGFSEIEIQTQLKPLLESALKLQKERGWTYDDNTKKMLADGEASGVLTKAMMETNDILLEGLSAVIKALGGELPDSFVRLRDRAREFSDSASNGLKEVAVNAGHLRDRLNSGDFTSWATDMSEAASEAYREVNTLEYGRSPGGLKEIPLMLRRSVAASADFTRKFRSDIVAAKNAVNDAFKDGSTISQVVEARQNFDTTPVNPEVQAGMRMDPARGTGFTVDALSAAISSALASVSTGSNVKVNISTLDAEGVDKIVRDKLTPALIETLRQNVRGSRTNLKLVLGE